MRGEGKSVRAQLTHRRLLTCSRQSSTTKAAITSQRIGTLQILPKMAEDEPKSIRSLFLTAERLRNNLNSFPDSNSSTYQENLTKAIATFESSLELSEQVALFSPNESLDDISSSDIQYVTSAKNLQSRNSVPRNLRPCLTSLLGTCP